MPPTEASRRLEEEEEPGEATRDSIGLLVGGGVDAVIAVSHRKERRTNFGMGETD